MTSIRNSEIADVRRRILRSRMAKAGLRGAYMDAECPEGSDAYQRFENGRGTYLWGLPGRGKTYAAASAVRLAVVSGKNAKLVTTTDLLGSIREGFDTNDFSPLARAKGYALLALDDLGVEKPTEWAMEIITTIIDARCASGLPTIITSNYSLGELRDRWGGMSGMRLASRIAGACERIEVAGPDRRLS